MQTAKTPEEIRMLLMRTHPADQPKVVAKIVKSDTKEALTDAKQAAKSATKAAEKAEALKEKVTELQKQTHALSQSLAIRQRMTPQDLRDALTGLFGSYNFSPAEELVQMIADPTHPFFISDVRLRVSVLQDLNSYVMPKLKNVEIQGRVKHAHTVTILRIGPDGKRVKEVLPESASPPQLRGIAQVIDVSATPIGEGGGAR